MALLRLVVCCLFLLVLPGSSSAAAGTDQELPVLSGEAGFYEIEPVAFSFQDRTTPLRYVSSRARVSYSFHPADNYPSWKPLFVFFNGGPGCATCNGLLSLNTSPFTLDKERTGGKSIKRNPYSWTAIGNLLYIDAPNTGFSYNLIRNVSDPKRRAAEFDAQNFNPFVDAAQMTRVVLRFLAVHPSLQSNPVILVGESYGGIRATTMLNMLLFYGKYGNGTRIYRDKTLAREIRQHLEEVFPDESARPFPPSVIARQFGRQVLIEPALAGSYQDRIAGELFEQEGSPIYKIAAETGKTYTPCSEVTSAGGGRPCRPFDNALDFVIEAGRDIYNYAKPADWFMGLSNFAERGLLHVNVLSRAFGWDPLFVVDLSPAARTEAYRYKKSRAQDLESLFWSSVYYELPAEHRMRIQREVGLLESGKEASASEGVPEASEGADLKNDTLVRVLGALKPWDDYLVGCNESALVAFYRNSATKAGYRIAPNSVLYGKMFLQNLALVETFITNAAFDLVIYAPAVPLALAKYSGIVKDVTVQDGYMVVTYKPHSLPDIPTPKSRIVFFPDYERSGHGVAASQPKKLLEDVRDWMLSWTADSAKDSAER